MTDTKSKSAKTQMRTPYEIADSPPPESLEKSPSPPTASSSSSSAAADIPPVNVQVQPELAKKLKKLTVTVEMEFKEDNEQKPESEQLGAKLAKKRLSKELSKRDDKEPKIFKMSHEVLGKSESSAPRRKSSEPVKTGNTITRKHREYATGSEIAAFMEAWRLKKSTNQPLTKVNI